MALTCGSACFLSCRYFLPAVSGQELQEKDRTKEAEGKEDQKGSELDLTVQTKEANGKHGKEDQEDAELESKKTCEKGSPKEDQKKPVLEPEPKEQIREAEDQNGEGLRPQEKVKEVEPQQDKDDTGGKGVQSAKAVINADHGKVTTMTKGSQKTLPGPTWPLDSHPDRVKEYLVKWNMLGKVEHKPVEPNPGTAKDEKNILLERQRPDGWAEVGDFVQPGVQAPQKPRGRKKQAKNDDGNENEGKGLNDASPKPRRSRAPKRGPQKDNTENGQEPCKKKTKGGGSEPETKKGTRKRAPEKTEAEDGDGKEADQTSQVQDVEAEEMTGQKKAKKKGEPKDKKEDKKADKMEESKVLEPQTKIAKRKRQDDAEACQKKARSAKKKEAEKNGNEEDNPEPEPKKGERQDKKTGAKTAKKTRKAAAKKTKINKAESKVLDKDGHKEVDKQQQMDAQEKKDEEEDKEMDELQQSNSHESRSPDEPEQNNPDPGVAHSEEPGTAEPENEDGGDEERGRRRSRQPRRQPQDLTVAQREAKAKASRKSSAYHMARSRALRNGCCEETAKKIGKRVRNSSFPNKVIKLLTADFFHYSPRHLVSLGICHH